MKKKIVTVLLLVVFIIFLYLQWGRIMDVVNSFSTSSTNYHEENIVVVANKLYISNKEKFAEKIVNNCIENNFKSIFFDYKTMKPNALYVTVYSSEFTRGLSMPAFTFSYTSDKNQIGLYNIIDDSENYRIIVDEQ